jgi:hypothetical protein
MLQIFIMLELQHLTLPDSCMIGSEIKSWLGHTQASFNMMGANAKYPQKQHTNKKQHKELHTRCSSSAVLSRLLVPRAS